MIRLLLFLSCSLALNGSLMAQTREEKVRNDRTRVETDGFWIYNDFARAVALAQQTGKPMVVVLRCVPCVECVKLDDELVDKDPRVGQLLEKFVCVRLVSTNGLDLSLFQYDYDQSFAVFFLTADGTIYGRFGTRSHRTQWIGDVSIDGLAKALQGALALHEQYPANKSSLAGKRGKPPEVPVPEQFTSLRGKKAKLNYDAPVVEQCIHCHQIGEAQREHYLKEGGSIPEKILFQYPHPKTLGLILDPHERAKVLRVETGSPAARAGFEANDEILNLAGQTLLSIADVQWVLHQTDPAGGHLNAQVRRAGKSMEVTLTLEPGWRRHEDLSWRASTWALRRMATGGMLLKTLPPEDRAKAGFPSDQMALLVEYMGDSGPHGAAKHAGFRTGDIIIAVGGHQNLVRETDFIAEVLRKYKVGDLVPITVWRGGNKVALKLPVQA